MSNQPRQPFSRLQRKRELPRCNVPRAAKRLAAELLESVVERPQQTLEVCHRVVAVDDDSKLKPLIAMPDFPEKLLRMAEKAAA